MNSLLWTLASDRFRNCKTGCGVVLRTTKHGDKFNAVEICEPCRKVREEEDARNAALPPTEETIREIVNGRLELFAAKRTYEHFYEKWMHEMPYGTAKARDGDPYEWVFYQLSEEYSHLIEDESESA